MGIFAHGIKEVSGISSIVEDASLESVLQDSDVDTSMLTEDPEYDGNEIIGTIYENYNTIMTNVALTEATYFERTGEDYVLTEGVLSNFVGMIKKFLKKIWEKIKGLFKRFTMMIDKYNMQDRAFVKKYRKELFSGKDLTDFTFKGYKYTIDDKKVGTSMQMCSGKSSHFKDRAGEGREEFENDKDQDKLNDKYNDDLEKFRGKVLGVLGSKGSGAYTQDEFAKELKEVWRNNESEKEELDDISINTIADELMTSKDTKKILNTLFKEAKKAIEADEKEVERRQKDLWNELPYDEKTGKQKTRHDKDDYERAKAGYDSYTGGGVKTIGGVQYTADALNDIYKRMANDCEREINNHQDDMIGGQKLGDLNPIGQRGWDNSGNSYRRIEHKTGSNGTWNDWERFCWFVKNFQQSRKDPLNIQTPNKDQFKQTNKQYANRASKEFNLFLRMIRDTKVIMMSIQTSCMAALKERSRQNKAICVKVINYNPKSESFTESYEEDSTPTSGVNFLSSIELK